MAADKMVNGRKAILQCLDSVLARENNIKKFGDMFQDCIDTDPLVFFKAIVMPLLPKEIEERVDDRILKIEIVPDDGVREQEVIDVEEER